MLCAEAHAAGDPASGPAVRLPRIDVAAEPTTAAVIASLDRLLGASVTLLRANVHAWHPNFDAASMFVEVEPLDVVPPANLHWHDIDASAIDSLVPEPARPSVRTWFVEQASGWAELRPQWSRPGWVAEAGAWMRAQMASAGYADPQPPTVHHLWGLSVVLAAESRDGTAYLKCSGDRFRGEAAVTQALAARSPAHLPSVVAIEPERGWLLMRDFAAPELGERPEASWGAGLDALLQLQHAWLGRGDELVALGAESRPLWDLAVWVESSTEDAAVLSGLMPEQRSQWLDAVPTMVQACHRLDELGPEPSLVHGDFHPWNVAMRDGGALIFDWTDASVANPMLDVVTYVMRSREASNRRALLRGYLDGWADHFSGAARRELGNLALVVGALHQAHTYAHIIPTVMPDDLSQLLGGDVEWIQRALRYRDEGLAAKY